MKTPHRSTHAVSSLRVTVTPTSSTVAPAALKASAAARTALSITGSTAHNPRSIERASRMPSTDDGIGDRRSRGHGTERRSASSGPWVTCRNSRASSIVLASGPWCEIRSKRPGRPSMGIRPSPGLRPTTPHQAAGMRTEPPMSVPSARGTQPAATAAALPPDEPPGVRSRFHGFFVTPQSGLSVSRVWANSGVVVFPTTIAPARWSAPTM